jgi:1-phosphofructokinase
MTAAPHIFTLTGNLLAERTFEFATWAPGKTQRASSETFQVGGKGINVSKMLTRLGAVNTALCFTGAAAGEECENWLRNHRFSYRSFHTDRGTRVGTVVRSANHAETTFLGPDIPPSNAAVAACAEFLEAQEDGQILACCGSFPGWMGEEFNPLRNALTRWLNRGILVVDTYGPPLAWLAQRPVALVKINATEARTLFGEAESVDQSLTSHAARLPVSSWVVSDGPELVTFRDGPKGDVHTMKPPEVHEISATGSGDVLFAVLIHSLFLRHESLRESLEKAVSLAAANAAHPGIAEFPEMTVRHV